MSQILVTGEAKIRDIQGPVVANDGVVTALDGAANQYVRGDGTLAIFPTSTGGGSSVSYYLNGSVNQGTFGGSTYYQMSKDAITGTGTNFSTSSNGLIAQFITDANDPDVVSIPSGNWNIEFYMGVSASSGSLASFYVEIYKYDGSAFTLIATNVATPEYLTNTTTVDAYFTSVAMPTTALALTDRLAVRIYANVASKTVTLYTEDNRLCQIVTTFSKGILSINGLTDQSQNLTTGTSGTNFNIASSGDTHTFNLPIASATNTGKLSSTDWSTFNNKQPAGNYVTLDTTQTITAAKTFSNSATFQASAEFDYGVLLKDGSTSSKAGYFNIASLNSTTLAFLSSGGRAFDLILPTSGGQITVPNGSGTLALTSNLSSYVPYTGATTFVNLGTQLFYSGGVVVENAGNGLISTDGSLSAGKGIFLTNTVSGGQWSSGTTNLVARNSGFLITRSAGGGLLIFDSAVTYDYTFPSSNGTIALTSNLSSYLPLSGGTLTGALSGTSATFSSSLIVGSTSILYGNVAIKSNSATSYFGLNVIANGNNNFIALNHTGSVGVIETEFSTGGSHTPIAFVTSGSERMRITSDGNLGLGTTTPSRDPSGTRSLAISGASVGYAASLDLYATRNYAIYTGGAGSLGFYDLTAGAERLTIASTGAATFSSSGNPSLTINGTDGAYTSLLYLNAAGGGSSKIFANGGANTLSLGTNNSEKLTITSGGNVGIGTSSPNALLEVAGTSANTDFRVSRSVSSSTYFYVKAPGGSPSTATMGVNGTDVMVLNSSGNVGIGTSSPYALLSVYGGSAGDRILIDSFSGSGSNGAIAWGAGSVPNISARIRGIDDGFYGTHLLFETRGNSGPATTTSERMRITSGGNVLIGSTSDNGYKQQTYGGFYLNGTDLQNPLDATFYLFNRQNNDWAVIVDKATADFGVRVNIAGASQYAYSVYNSTTSAFSYYVYGNGDVRNTNNSYGAISDIKHKENITDATPKLDDLLKVKIRNYNLIGDDKKQIGVIAQELEEIFPNMIDEIKEKDSEEITKSVKYSVFVPMLIKAIQELNEKIKQLENK